MPEFSTFISCNPPTSTNQSQRGIYVGKDGRPHVFTKSKGRNIENALCSILHAHRPPEDFPRNLPASVEIVLSFPYRKTEKKSIVRERRAIPHSSRPDIDNLVKFLLDCMTRTGFWDDDSQIYDLRIRKYFSPLPGIGIRIVAGNEVPSILASLKQIKEEQEVQNEAK